MPTHRPLQQEPKEKRYSSNREDVGAVQDKIAVAFVISRSHSLYHLQQRIIGKYVTCECGQGIRHEKDPR